MQREFNKAVRIVFAYLLASFGCVILGWVSGIFITEMWQVQINYKMWISAVWLLICGTSSSVAMIEYLSRTMGTSFRPSAALRSVNSRLVPINYNTGQSFLSSLNFPQLVERGQQPGQSSGQKPAVAQQPPTIDLFEIQIETPDYVFDEEFLTSFFSTCWSRQQTGKKAFSRVYWVDRGELDKEEYKELMAALVQYGLVAGRRERRSGKLVYSPSRSKNHLRSILWN